MLTRRAPLVALLVAIVGCDSSTPFTPDMSIPDLGAADLGTDVTDSTTVDVVRTDIELDAPLADGGSCVLDTTECVDKQHQRRCTAAGWVTETCPTKTLCLDAKCSASCIDQCALGQTRTSSGQTETCQPFSVADDKTVPLGQGLHDRARQFDAWIRQRHLPAGTIASVYFTNSTYGTLASYSGTGDSAIWTGSYLAGEALRLEVTGSPDAKANVETMVEAIHRLFEVTGHPGYLARYTAPLQSGDPLIDTLYDPANKRHHKVSYLGKDHFWSGNTSRDQYQGVLLGYALAYEALTSSMHRQMIRDDMVALCEELIKERKGVTVNVRFKALGQWVDLPVKLDLQYVVMNPTEYENGAPYIQVGQDSDPSNYERSSMLGFREYWPDYSTVLKQIPGLGALIGFSIPRSGSAIMLASILRVGMLVTEGVPGYASQHAAFKSHYNQQIQSWLKIMKQYVFLNAAQCWKSYYGLNIVFQPVYNLVRLEPDPALKTAFQTDVLAGKMWPIVKDHKNVYFSYIHASQAPPSSTIQSVITGANNQLAMIPAGFFADLPFDLTGLYPANPSCANQSSVAIDADHRPGSHFIWQRHPFMLKNTGEALRVYPRIDFTLPYWMARHHGFMSDDADGTCLRWD